MSREINDQNYLEELFINEATPALENAGGGGNSAELEEGKALIAEAITNKGVETAADASFDVMAENIGKLANGIKIIGLGTTTSYDVKTVCANNGIDHTKLTASNFICVTTSIGRAAVSNISLVSGQWLLQIRNGYSGAVPAITGYNASTGVVTASNGWIRATGHNGNDSNRTLSGSSTDTILYAGIILVCAV